MVAFVPQEISAGLIFYPGGKVGVTTYAPLLSELAQEGILCVLVKMPCNLAVSDTDAADVISEKFPEVKEWYIGGHSLGGSMAVVYVAGARVSPASKRNAPQGRSGGLKYPSIDVSSRAI